MGRSHYSRLAAVAVAIIAAAELPAAPSYAQASDYPRRAITFVRSGNARHRVRARSNFSS
jgi:hypothetical protein